MKLTTAILVLGMAMGTAWATEPGRHREHRDTLQDGPGEADQWTHNAALAAAQGQTAARGGLCQQAAATANRLSAPSGQRRQATRGELDAE